MVRFRRSILFCTASAVIAVAAAAHAAPVTPIPTDPATRALLDLENSWATALIARDAATFHQLLAPGFVYTEDDRLMSRADVLRDVVSSTDTVAAAHNEGMAVHLFHPAGIVTGWLIVKGHGKDGPFEHRYRFTDTWLRRKGKWQIVAAQDYLKPRG